MQPYINRISRFFYNRSAGLLILRVAAGAIFLIGGMEKAGDMAGTILLFDTYGLSPLIALIVTWLEILGGISLILGIAPRIWAGFLGTEMLIAALAVGGAEGFEAAALYTLLGAASFSIMFIGSGRFALYKMECDTCNGLFCIKKNRVCVTVA